MLLSVLTRLETWRFLRDEHGARLAAQITREMAGIAGRLDIPLIDISPIPVNSIIRGTEDDALSVVQTLGRQFFEQAPGHRMSSLQDVLRRRPLELEETVGYALARARESGWRMPTVETCYRLARAINETLLEDRA
jgi:ketopantoate reductase